MNKLVNLFLADNQLEAVPFIPDSVRILHLQVCIFKPTAKIYTNKFISGAVYQYSSYHVVVKLLQSNNACIVLIHRSRKNYVFMPSSI